MLLISWGRFLVVAACVSLTTSRPVHALTFEERVAAQRGIEEVYWRHRIWPEGNPGPKPSLDAVQPQAAIEAGVLDYLRKSKALETLWQRPITAADLDAEMRRIAADTQAPEKLGEILVALGNDPGRIAECLARPLVADRLVRSLYARDSKLSSDEAFETWWAEKKLHLAAVVEVPPAAYAPIVSRATGVCTDDTWTPTGSGGSPPAARERHTAVWTGSEMIVWGGVGSSGLLQSGARYDPITNNWTPTSVGTNVPSARFGHTAVWTGTQMIVWGGSLNSSGTTTSTGARYNPVGNTWSAVAGAPINQRTEHTAVWTGSEMLVWGGRSNGITNSPLNTGGRYAPSGDTWSQTAIPGVPGARFAHTAVWTGSEMIVWGGTPDSFGTGGRYLPSNNSWSATTTGGAPQARYHHKAVWTGTEMIVWGGLNFSQSPLDTGGRYSPGNDNWVATSSVGAPSARAWFTMEWVGCEVIVWGGGVGQVTLTGGRYNPSTDGWRATSTALAPAARSDHSAAWTGSEWIVWGGGTSSPFNDGGRYCAGLPRYSRDLDGDGYGDPNFVTYQCAPPDGYVANDADCDDANSAIHPSASDANCNGIDENCNGPADEDFQPQPTTCGVGACLSFGSVICAGGELFDNCVPGAPSTEACDGADNDCNGTVDDAAPPTGMPVLLPRKPSLGVARLEWTTIFGATGYDIVRGALSVLRASSGNFTLATSACLANDVAANVHDDPNLPALSDGYWYLVRPMNCGGGGTYETGSSRQVGPRDIEIQAAGAACP